MNNTIIQEGNDFRVDSEHDLSASALMRILNINRDEAEDKMKLARLLVGVHRKLPAASVMSDEPKGRMEASE